MAEINKSGAPDKNTVGQLGDICINTVTGDRYKLVYISRTTTYDGTHTDYEWEFMNDVNGRSINVTHLFTEELTEDNTSLQFYNAFKYCVDNGYMAYVPRGTYIVSKINTSIDNAAALVIPNGANVIFENGVTFKLKADSPSWTRTVALHGNNKLYGHFEIDGSADTITNGNEHMAGLFSYGRSDIYIESLYSYNCYGDNVQLSGDASNLGHTIIIDNLKCRKAGRKNLVFEGTTNIHIKNAYLDNTEGGAGVWTGGGCLDVEPFSADVSCQYRIDRLETTGTNDFTVGTSYTSAPKYVLDIGTLVQHSGVFYSYSLTINIDTAIFYDCTLHCLYSANISIRNAIFMDVGRSIITLYGNSQELPSVNINNLKIYGNGETIFDDTNRSLIWIQGANFSVNNCEVYDLPVRFLGTQSTFISYIYFGNLYVKDSGPSGGDLTYLTGFESNYSVYIFDNIVVRDTRETPIKRAIVPVSTILVDKVRINNYSLSPSSISLGSTYYGNFKINIHGNGADTAYRPTNIKIGYQYYDTTLKKPIWWDGTKWTDSTGVEV